MGGEKEKGEKGERVEKAEFPGIDYHCSLLA
jgi:hypothetical protein